MRAQLAREMVVATLGGRSSTDPLKTSIQLGLERLVLVRRHLTSLGLGPALHAPRVHQEVRVSLPRGVTVLFSLALATMGASALVTIQTPRGTPRIYIDPVNGTLALVARIGANVDAGVRVLLGIERARKRCFDLTEAQTRWLI